MIKSEYTIEDENKILHEIHNNDINLWDLVEAFEHFLKAIRYSTDKLVIEEKQDD